MTCLPRVWLLMTPSVEGCRVKLSIARLALVRGQPGRVVLCVRVSWRRLRHSGYGTRAQWAWWFECLDELGTGLLPCCMVSVKVGCAGCTEILRAEIPMPGGDSNAWCGDLNAWAEISTSERSLGSCYSRLTCWKIDWLARQLSWPAR